MLIILDEKNIEHTPENMIKSLVDGDQKNWLVILLKTINRKRILIYIPRKISILMSKFFQVLPNPLLTEDQIKLLENNNIILNNDYTFMYLAINPVSLELILPDYLKIFKKY